MEQSLLNKKDGAFYDSYEVASEENRQEIKIQNLKNYFDYATKNSRYYFERREQYQINPLHHFPLRNIPVLTSQDLRSNLPPLNFNLLATEKRNYTIFQSGGTTGIPKTSLFSHQELEELNLPNARGFFATNLNEHDRVANLFAVGGLYMTFIHINRMLQQYGCMNFPFANNTPSTFIKSVMEIFHINTFTGITSVVLSALREIYEQGGKDLHIEKIYYGGEHIYESDIIEMKNKFGVEKVLAPGYGTVDTWYIGYQCNSTPQGVFHAHDDQCYLEIIDEEGQLCEAGKTGLLYATAFLRKITPIIRYNVGDRAVWLPHKCACGRTTPLFKLLGRGDDVLRIGYDSIDYNAIQNLIRQFPELSGNAQMEKRRRDGKDDFIVKIETDAPAEQWKELEQKFLNALMNDRPSLGTFIKKGLVNLPIINISGHGTIPRNQRTGKFIRVVDCL